MKQKRQLYKIIAAAVLFAVAFMLPVSGYWRLAVWSAAYLIVGLPIVRKAFRNIGHGQVFDENFLMTAATAGAFALGEYSEGVAVMLFYQIGELFQSYAVNKSRKSIAALMGHSSRLCQYRKGRQGCQGKSRGCASGRRHYRDCRRKNSAGRPDRRGLFVD